MLTDAEWKVMRCLWEKSPATARDVATRLDTGWAYTTVRTFLDRLAGKGAVRAKKAGGTLAYAPVLTRSQARRTA
ncbi:MAG: BlaI/MecI/CopY family transcriptional regulator, partial [Planctomycetes bacterium]|nr:BlaI/MecI/CopY family transcriptional regulator [Planctomycetota bacterium]